MSLAALAWLNQGYLNEQYTWFAVTRPYMMNSVRPYILTPAAEHSLKTGQTFRECAKDCPDMLVLPAGSFMMGLRTTRPTVVPTKARCMV